MHRNNGDRDMCQDYFKYVDQQEEETRASRRTRTDNTVSAVEHTASARKNGYVNAGAGAVRRMLTPIFRPQGEKQKRARGGELMACTK